jgi:hypothetical protein
MNFKLPVQTKIDFSVEIFAFSVSATFTQNGEHLATNFLQLKQNGLCPV